MAARKRKISVSEVETLVRQAEDLISKCKFLVRRSEFLYQQGLGWHAQAQELINDCAKSGVHVAAMGADIQALKDRLPKLRSSGRLRIRVLAGKRKLRR